jgi:superfamily II DNA/RNA helicase
VRLVPLRNLWYIAQNGCTYGRHDDLKKGIYAAGFKKPSKIQERALPLLLTNP